MVFKSFPLAAMALLVASCGSMNAASSANSSTRIGNAVVVDDEAFEPSRGNVLSILQMQVRGMIVSRQNTCPHIVVRGGAGRSQAAEVVVYVDGQRMSDTCVLDALDVEAIERAEVYRSGVTQRPGYTSNAGGLILVFMKNGEDSDVWQSN